VWSFDAAKIVVAGDGAMLTARDPALIRQAELLAFHGIRQSSGFSQARGGAGRWWEFEVDAIGRRSVMNDVQSAIGAVQLANLGPCLARRRRVVDLYDRELAGHPGLLTPPPLPVGHTSSYYMYWVQTRQDVRDGLAEDLYAAGVYTTFRYAPLHRAGVYGSTVSLPDAEWAAAHTLLLPLHQALSDDDVATVVDALRASLAHRSRPVGAEAVGGAR
jgi:aminotransferase